MNTTLRVIRYEVSNVLRGKGVIAYGLCFAVLGDALLRFGGDDAKALLSLASLVLFVVPLVSLIFGAMYLYGAREFNELLLAQPIRRRDLFNGLFLSVAAPLAAVAGVGLALPFLVHGVSDAAHWSLVIWLSSCAALLTFVFVAIAFWIALRVEDRARGLGFALLVWLSLVVLYDAAVLAIVATFGNYPLERPVLALIMFNPVDLARVLFLLQLDLSALMGYTGAVFENLLGNARGAALALTALLAWCALPLWRAGRTFARRDF